MTLAEFNAWWKYHRVHFASSVDAMLDKAASGQDAISRNETKAAWMKTLKSFSLDDAKAATDAMHAGLEGDVTWADRHPMIVACFCRKRKVAAKQATAHYVDGEMAVLCPTCEDSGFVFCWSSKTIRDVFQSRTTKGVVMTTAVYPCTCAAGDIRLKCFPNAPRYDPRKTCAVGGGGVRNEEAEQRLMEWVESYKRTVPDNFEPAFSDFSQPQTEIEF